MFSLTLSPSPLFSHSQGQVFEAEDCECECAGEVDGEKGEKRQSSSTSPLSLFNTSPLFFSLSEHFPLSLYLSFSLSADTHGIGDVLRDTCDWAEKGPSAALSLVSLFSRALSGYCFDSTCCGDRAPECCRNRSHLRAVMQENYPSVTYFRVDPESREVVKEVGDEFDLKEEWGEGAGEEVM